MADQSGQFVAYLPDSKFSVHTSTPGFVQPCAVSATVPGDVALQVEVTSVSTLDSLDPPRPQSAHGLSLSGTVFNADNGVNAPVAGAQIWVQYYDDIPVATTLTDQRGEYFVCNLPEVVGVYVSKPGYATDFLVIRPQETPSRDIEMRSVVNAGAGPFYDLVGRIESVSAGTRTVTLFGVEFTVAEAPIPGFSVDLSRLSVGQRIRILTYEDHVIRGIERVDQDWFPGMSEALIGGRFGDLSPPMQFALSGIGDWVVQVSPTTSLHYHWLGDPGWPGECGGKHVSADQFWQLAAAPQPSGPATVLTWGRFEGGVFLASSVYICFQAPPV